MTQRTMLILAAAISVFAMALVGGLAIHFAAQPNATATPDYRRPIGRVFQIRSYSASASGSGSFVGS